MCHHSRLNAYRYNSTSGKQTDDGLDDLSKSIANICVILFKLQSTSVQCLTDHYFIYSQLKKQLPWQEYPAAWHFYFLLTFQLSYYWWQRNRIKYSVKKYGHAMHQIISDSQMFSLHSLEKQNYLYGIKKYSEIRTNLNRGQNRNQTPSKWNKFSVE